MTWTMILRMMSYQETGRYLVEVTVLGLALVHVCFQQQYTTDTYSSSILPRKEHNAT